MMWYQMMSMYSRAMMGQMGQQFGGGMGGMSGGMGGMSPGVCERMRVIHVSVRAGFSSRRFEPIHETGAAFHASCHKYPGINQAGNYGTCGAGRVIIHIIRRVIPSAH
nr:hypothetical protein BaRGS_007923 [Batillaria attramentaria]